MISGSEDLKFLGDHEEWLVKYSKRKLEVDLSHTKKRLTEVERSRDLLMTGNGDGNGQQIGGDGTGDSTFNTIAQEDQEHQDELKKYLDRLDAM